MNWYRLSELSEIIPIDVPDGQSGDWRVSTFEVSKEAEKMGMMRAIFSSSRGRYVPAGTYKGLYRGGSVIMSNTPDEVSDLYEFFRAVKGEVLINGLGLGVALRVILDKVNEKGNPVVTGVTVVEFSEDVIQLVAPAFKSDPRVHIVHVNALEYRPVCPKSGKFDAVWHDIWDDITSENLPEMKRLHRKYGSKS